MILYIFAACYKALLFTKMFFLKTIQILFFCYNALTFSEAFVFSLCVSMMFEFFHMDYFAECLELVSDELFACVHCGY